MPNWTKTLAIVGRIAANHKLLEALGLAAALGGWSLDWWSVQTSAATFARFESAHYRSSEFYFYSDLRLVTQLEQAINRALRDRPSAITTLFNSYSQAWESPEVRELWWNKSINDAVMLNIQLANLHKAFKSGGVEKPPWLAQLDQQVAALGKRVSPATVHQPDGTYRPVIRYGDLSLKDLVEIGTQVENAQHEVEKRLIEVNEDLHSRLEDRRRAYRFVFGLGAFLIMLSKLLAWRVDVTKESAR